MSLCCSCLICNLYKTAKLSLIIMTDILHLIYSLSMLLKYYLS